MEEVMVVEVAEVVTEGVGGGGGGKVVMEGSEVVEVVVVIPRPIFRIECSAFPAKLYKARRCVLRYFLLVNS